MFTTAYPRWCLACTLAVTLLLSACTSESDEGFINNVRPPNPSTVTVIIDGSSTITNY